MSNLKTKYMGFELKNPLIISSSGLTGTPESAVKCADAGAGAVVLKSIFEEQIMSETEELINEYQQSYSEEAMGYIKRMSFEHSLSGYIDLIQKTKQNVDIPVIASINCASLKGWTNFAQRIEHAGADALELNIFIVPVKVDVTGKEIDDLYVKIFKEVKRLVNIPVAVKLGPFFTNIGNVAKRLSDEGAASIVLFNRFQTVAVTEEETEDAELDEGKWLSTPSESELVRRWLSILYGNVKCDLSATSGLRTGRDVINSIKDGASAVQIASALYLNGIEHVKVILKEIEEELSNYGSSLEELKGINSVYINNASEKIDRVQYFRAISVLNKYIKNK